jgi:hypothetical protein
MIRAKRLALAAIVLSLAACDKPNQPDPPRDWGKAVAWNQESRGFQFDDRPASVVRAWDFEASGKAEGFTPLNATMSAVKGQGLILTNGADPGVRSPDDLKTRGNEAALLVVRLTRRQATSRWDGSVFHQTRRHKESEEFATRLPVAPQAGAAAILVYPMASSSPSGRDWARSLIKQLRIDLEAAGGETVIHQIALVREPL